MIGGLAALGGVAAGSAVAGGDPFKGIELVGKALEKIGKENHPAVRIKKIEEEVGDKPLNQQQMREVIGATAELFTRNLPSTMDAKTIAQNTVVLRGLGNFDDQKDSVTYPYKVKDPYDYSQPYNNESYVSYSTGTQIVVASDLVNHSEYYERDRRFPLRKFTLKSAQNEADCGEKPAPVSILTTALLKSMIDLQYGLKEGYPYSVDLANMSQDLSEEIRASYEEVSYRLLISPGFDISLGLPHVTSAKRKDLVLEFVGYDDPSKWGHKGPSAEGIKKVRFRAFSDFVENYFVLRTLFLNELNYVGDVFSVPARIIEQRDRILDRSAGISSDQDLFEYLSGVNPNKNIETIIANIGKSWDPDKSREEQLITGLTVVLGFDLDRAVPSSALIPCLGK